MVSGRVALPALRYLVAAFYLTAAGWFFIMVPWSAFWTQKVVTGCPYWWMARVIGHGALRGALSAFGVLHFAVAFSWLNSGPAGPPPPGS
jgi:hypothetical protein